MCSKQNIVAHFCHELLARMTAWATTSCVHDIKKIISFHFNFATKVLDDNFYRFDSNFYIG